MKLWGGRFQKETASEVEEFTSSIFFDKRLYRYDIEGSLAHAKMLEKCGILNENEYREIVSGLKQIEKEIESGDFDFQHSREDIHMHIESRLIELTGDAGEKLHTGRSRNDQVALDMRLYLRDIVGIVNSELLNLREVLLKKAQKNINRTFPGFTHMQPAQPTTFAHHLLAYDEQFMRDYMRFEELSVRINVSPLGSGAMAGTTLPVDREYTASLLDFTKTAENTMDAVSDRDFIIEFLSDAALVMMHLSRFCEEIVMWSAPQNGYIEIPDQFCTGSSIMPQKKNPDAAELIRAKTARVYGSLMQMLTLLKGLPMAYNRDMQEDKESLFDAVDTLIPSVRVFREMLRGLKINAQAVDKALKRGFIAATDISDYLVKKGVPFRTTHKIVGRIVRFCIEQDKNFEDLSLKEWKEHSLEFERDIFEIINIEESVKKRAVTGGPAPEIAAESIKKKLNKLRKIKEDS